MSQSPVKRYLMMTLSIVIVVSIVAFVFNMTISPQGPNRPPKPTVPKGTAKSSLPSMTLTITNHEGKVLPGTKISARSRYKNGNTDNKTYLTNPEGKADILLRGEDCTYLSLDIKPRQEPMVFSSMGDKDSKTILELPDSTEIKIPKGRTIGGQVLNEAGEPVKSARVEVYSSVSKPKPLESDFNKEYKLFNQSSVATDKEGRWELKGVPVNVDSIGFVYRHSTYHTAGQTRNRDYLKKSEFPALFNRTKIHTMQKMISLTGRVTDTDGNPIVGALIVEGYNPFDRPNQNYAARTNQEGKFDYRGAARGKSLLTVMSFDYAPHQVELELHDQLAPLDIVLQKGEKFEIKVLDAQGNPVPDVFVNPYGWRAEKEERQNRNMWLLGNTDKDLFTTDHNGIYTWQNAPQGRLSVTFMKEGYLRKNEGFNSTDSPIEYKLLKEKKITVKVLDAASGKPLPAFSYYWGRPYNSGSNTRYSWQDYRVRKGEKGEFVFEGENYKRVAFKIMAPDHKPAISETVDIANIKEETIEITVKLEEGYGPKGKIVHADGTPAANAIIKAYTSDGRVRVTNGAFSDLRRNLPVTADASGNFELLPLDGAYGLIAIHEAGYAQALDQEFAKTKQLVLQPWAKVSGTLIQKGKPLAERVVSASVNQSYQENVPRLYFNYSIETDAQGKFTFDKMIASKATSFGQESRIQRSQYSTSSTNSHEVRLEIEPGKEYEIKLGGKGRPVIGKVKLPAGKTIAKSFQRLSGNTPRKQDVTQAFGGLARLVQQSTGVNLGPTAQPVPPFQQSYPFILNEKGAFRIEDVPAGKYMIYIRLHEASEEGHEGNRLGNLNQQIEVPEIEAEYSDEAFDLGLLEPKK